jgi:hypothetical protein
MENLKASGPSAYPDETDPENVQILAEDVYLSFVACQEEILYGLSYKSKQDREFTKSHIKLLTEIIDKKINLTSLEISNFSIQGTFLKSILNMTKKLKISKFTFSNCQISNQDVIDIVY